MKVAINGFGRIGALFTRAYIEYWQNDFDIVAINASGTSGNMTPREVMHRLKYDSNYGASRENFEVFGDAIHLSNSWLPAERTITILGEPNAERLPWKELGVDIVIECTGEHLTAEKASGHLTAGAKKVILSAPPKNEDIPILVYGVNHRSFNPETKIVSNGSCTTNALAPLVKVIQRRSEIIYEDFDAIHAFTGDQRLTDGKHSDPRRARRASGNIIPTKTGAAKNIEQIFPELNGRTNGLAFRVDTPTVSAIHPVFILKGETIEKEALVNDFKDAAYGELHGILDWTEEELVSSDFLKNTNSVIVDIPLLRTQPVRGHGISVVSMTGWYDNEWAYACRLGDLLNYIIAQRPWW
jgi:glyceraldehyde 3-phosphate dehydrogenase